MSVGGDFYALSDQQLDRLLFGALNYAAFLANELPEKPSDCFTGAEYCWFDLTQLLSDRVFGTPTDLIPEAAGYVYAKQVPAVLQTTLTALDQAEFLSVCEAGEFADDATTLWAATQGLKAFYERAAAQGEAILFRVT